MGREKQKEKKEKINGVHEDNLEIIFIYNMDDEMDINDFPPWERDKMRNKRSTQNAEMPTMSAPITEQEFEPDSEILKKQRYGYGGKTIRGGRRKSRRNKSRKNRQKRLRR